MKSETCLDLLADLQVLDRLLRRDRERAVLPYTVNKGGEFTLQRLGRRGIAERDGAAAEPAAGHAGPKDSRAGPGRLDNRVQLLAHADSGHVARPVILALEALALRVRQQARRGANLVTLDNTLFDSDITSLDWCKTNTLPAHIYAYLAVGATGTDSSIAVYQGLFR